MAYNLKTQLESVELVDGLWANVTVELEYAVTEYQEGRGIEFEIKYWKILAAVSVDSVGYYDEAQQYRELTAFVNIFDMAKVRAAVEQSGKENWRTIERAIADDYRKELAAR